jgi:hypothetical protein
LERVISPKLPDNKNSGSQTDVLVEKDRSSSRMEILEPGDIVDLGVDDDPLLHE